MTAEQFLTCLDKADHGSTPFDHWLLADALPTSVVDAIVDLPFEPPSGSVFDGRRESNNSTRVYFSPENQARFDVCRDLVAAFRDERVLGRIEAMTGAKVANGHLRIEYCQDTDGFWLEPHVDIAVKMFTMLIYLSGEPELFDAGTDIYDTTPEHNLFASVPYQKNRGLIFIPASDTWHGFRKRPIRGIRKSIIVNYVRSDWRAVEELA